MNYLYSLKIKAFIFYFFQMKNFIKWKNFEFIEKNWPEVLIQNCQTKELFSETTFIQIYHQVMRQEDFPEKAQIM